MPELTKTSTVIEVAPADSAKALAHFEALLGFETDCWDVHAALTDGVADFVLLDVRGARSRTRTGTCRAPSTSLTGASSRGTWHRSPPTPCSLSIAPDRIATAPTKRPSVWRGWDGR